MEYFWYTSEIIPEGLGFTLFSPLHVYWLCAGALLTVFSCIFYRKASAKVRVCWKKTVALLLIADELFKLVPMLILGRFKASYLPFHLCSVNLFLVALHTWCPNRLLSNFLYTVCIPGALAALLFPSWTNMPAANYMLIHSFTVHILLLMYPVVLTAAGEIKPRLKDLPGSLILLVLLAVMAFGINQLLDTNFMFLSHADAGNPLYIFEQLWGSHLLGFPVIIAGVILVMYGPVELVRRIKKRQKA